MKLAAARAKNISLTLLHSVAMQRSKEAGMSNAGAGPAVAAYWSEVVRLIDAK